MQQGCGTLEVPAQGESGGAGNGHRAERLQGQVSGANLQLQSTWLGLGTELGGTSGDHTEHWPQGLTSRTACVLHQPQLEVLHQVLL